MKKDLKVLKFPTKSSNLERQVEAVLFAAEEPLDQESIQDKLKQGKIFWIFCSPLKNNIKAAE